MHYQRSHVVAACPPPSVRASISDLLPSHYSQRGHVDRRDKVSTFHEFRRQSALNQQRVSRLEDMMAEGLSVPVPASTMSPVAGRVVEERRRLQEWDAHIERQQQREWQQKFGETWTDEQLFEAGTQEVLCLLRDRLGCPELVNALGDIRETRDRVGSLEPGAAREVYQQRQELFESRVAGRIREVFQLRDWLLSRSHELLQIVSPPDAVSYTHLRAHETPEHLVCRLLLEKKKNI
eukprot:TRINITY_DN7332_c0_g1_i2.p1 TRINITY_DN7332_c0_g1~~TRINITY_DN7332_c0_g1_i2.p1  ORF type:complete len:236 (+),score=40.30 TRINITY_DN7332_c0_g1_i2:1-708(+)